MRRIVLLVAVAALMAVMMAASAMPAFAAAEPKGTNSQGNFVGQVQSSFTANGTGPYGHSHTAQYDGRSFGDAMSFAARLH